MPFVTEVYEMYAEFGTRRHRSQRREEITRSIYVSERTMSTSGNMFGKDITAGTLLFNDKLTAGVEFVVTDSKRYSFNYNHCEPTIFR